MKCKMFKSQFLCSAMALGLFVLGGVSGDGWVPGVGVAMAAKTRIVVFARPPQGVSQGQALFIQRTLSKALRRKSKIDVPTQGQLLKALYSQRSDPQDPARYTKMKKFLAKAKAIYGIKSYALTRRCKYVIGALKVVRKTNEELSSTSRKPALLEQMYLYYALAFHGLNETDKARKYSLLLMRQTPTFQLPGGLPGKFVRFYNKVGSWLNSQPRYTMKISSKPVGARVYHNYRYVGTTPHTLSNLFMGKHRLRLTLIKRKPWERVANLSPAKLKSRRSINATIPMKFDPMSAFLVKSPLYAKDANYSDEILDKLDSVATRTNAKYLFFAKPIKAQDNFWLRIAFYLKKSRKIRYKNVKLGKTSGSIQSSIAAFASSIKG